MIHYKCTENILSIILLDYSINFEEKFDEAVKRNKLKKFLKNMSESLYWIFVDYIWQNEKGTFFPEDMVCVLKNAINKIKKSTVNK